MSDVLTKESIKALGAETRQDILKLLSERPYTSTEMAKKLNKHVTTVKEHLSMLEKSGFINKSNNTNKFVYYELSSKGYRITKNYSWIIVFSLSIVCLFIGAVNLIGLESVNVYQSAELKLNAPAALPQAVQTFQEPSFIGIAFIILALIGFAYLYIIKKKSK